MSISSREFIAYRGQAFNIEWYYDEQGKSQALEHFKVLSERQQDALLVLLKRMGDTGKIFDITKFRNEGNKIFAFKPQPDRFLCFFFTGRKIVITNGFTKKSQKLPDQEKEKALKAKLSYEQRVKRKLYYEKL